MNAKQQENGFLLFIIIIIIKLHGFVFLGLYDIKFSYQLLQGSNKDKLNGSRIEEKEDPITYFPGEVLFNLIWWLCTCIDAIVLLAISANSIKDQKKLAIDTW